MFNRQKLEQAQADIESLSTLNRKLIAENQVLRKLNGVVDNAIVEGFPVAEAIDAIQQAADEIKTGPSIDDTIAKKAKSLAAVAMRQGYIDSRAKNLLQTMREGVEGAVANDAEFVAEVDAEARQRIENNGELAAVGEQVKKDAIEKRNLELLAEEREKAQDNLDTEAIDAEIQGSADFVQEIARFTERAKEAYQQKRLPELLVNAKEGIQNTLREQAPEIDQELVDQWLQSEEGLAYKRDAEQAAQDKSDKELRDAGQLQVDNEVLQQELEKRAKLEAEALATKNKAAELLAKLQGPGLDLDKIPAGSRLTIRLGEMTSTPVEPKVNDRELNEFVDRPTRKITQAIDRLKTSAVQGIADLHTYDRSERNLRDNAAGIVSNNFDQRLNDTIKDVITGALRAMSEAHAKETDQLLHEGFKQPEQAITLDVAHSLTFVKESDGLFIIDGEEIRGLEDVKAAIGNKADEMLLTTGSLVKIGSTQTVKGTKTIANRIRLGGDLAIDEDPQEPAVTDTLFKDIYGTIVEVELDGISCYHESSVTRS